MASSLQLNPIDNCFTQIFLFKILVVTDSLKIIESREIASHIGLCIVIYKSYVLSQRHKHNDKKNLFEDPYDHRNKSEMERIVEFPFFNGDICKVQIHFTGNSSITCH